MTITRKKRLLMIITLIGCLFLISSFGFKGMGKKVLAQEIESEAVMQEDSNLTEEETARREGLGRNINIFTSTSAAAYERDYTVIDETLLSSFQVYDGEAGESTTQAISTTNIEDLRGHFSIEVELGGGVGTFFGGVEANLSSAYSLSYSSYMFKYLYSYSHEIDSSTHWIQNYRNKETYSGKFSQMFLDDLENIEQGHMTYEQLFDKYGTHLIGQTIYGARIYATYVILSNKIALNQDFSAELGASLSTSNIFSLIADVDVYAAIEALYGTNYTAQDISINFNTRCVGSAVLPGTSMSAFETAYVDWVADYDASTDAELVDFADDGLVPLWEILPDEYASLADGMESCFAELYEDAEIMFDHNYSTENDLDFYGGTGTQLDPFLIANETNLSNIRKFMGSNFRIMNNIEMAILNWNPIGGYYKDTPFQGELDGDNYTISGLRRSNDVAEQNNRIYYGLFGYIGDKGKVKDLKLAYSNINLTGPEVDNSTTRVFVGAVAGFCAGTLDNVHVQYGTVKYYCETNGISFVGGLVGLARGATIKNCSNSAEIISCRYSAVSGGIAGYMSGGTIDFCSNSGSVTSYYTGAFGTGIASGIVGEVYSGTTFYITNCSNSVEPKIIKYDNYLAGGGHVETLYRTTAIDYE